MIINQNFLFCNMHKFILNFYCHLFVLYIFNKHLLGLNINADLTSDSTSSLFLKVASFLLPLICLPLIFLTITPLHITGVTNVSQIHGPVIIRSYLNQNPAHCCCLNSHSSSKSPS